METDTLVHVIPTVDVMFAILNLLVGISSILMNFLVFLVYFKLNYKHPTYFLFLNITFHDAVSGFTGIYMGIFLLYSRPEKADLGPGVMGLCVTNGILWSLTAFTTPTLLCIASGFRFMAIYLPYSYKDTVNFRNASIGVVLGWLVGGISTLVPMISGSEYRYTQTGSVCDIDYQTVNVGAMVVFILVPLLVPLCVLMLCNAAVLVHLCKCTSAHGTRTKSSDIQQHEQPLTGSGSSTSKVPQFGAICEWKTKVARKDYHTATTVVLMTLNYFICYSLWVVYFIQRIVTSSADPPDDGVTAGKETTFRFFSDNESGVIYIDATIKLMACMNSALNGIVHIARGSQIRAQIRRMWEGFVGSGTSAASDNHHGPPGGGGGVPITLNTQMSASGKPAPRSL